MLKALIATAAIITTTATAHPYHHLEDWPTLPEGLKTLGPSHGEIDIDSQGLLYVSVMGGEKRGIQIYSPDGQYLRNLPNARNNHHGFTIVQENGQDIIYAACLKDPKTALLKLSTTGEILLEIPLSHIPKTLGETFALTHADVAPNGDIFLIDGYASSKLLIFSKTGEFKKSTAGKGNPWNFDTAHKFAFDHRFQPPRILICDRSNDRLVHLTLEGEMIGEYATGIARPCTVDFHGENVAVAQLASGITILDKQGKTLHRLGANPDPKQSNTNKVEPKDWRNGITTSPHGLTYDKHGNIITTEWNRWGRLLRWEIKP